MTDKSVIKYMHEMSMPVCTKQSWYKTRIDTPSLVSAAPQEDLIYWQNDRKLTQNRLQSTDICRFILFPNSSFSFTILIDLTITIALSLKNLSVTLTINFLNIHLDFLFQVNLLDTFQYLHFIPTPRKNLELNYQCLRVMSF